MLMMAPFLAGLGGFNCVLLFMVIMLTPVENFFSWRIIVESAVWYWPAGLIEVDCKILPQAEFDRILVREAGA